ncbi:hypothetical protein B0H39_003418 [Clostridium beijerinckii]|uniref:phage head-tail connector protein n=1 Tax=Clostridium beijerinckii TaxID=1520 RepID=UPI0014944D70|nr:phage head-tail connector protein [Clostridium beijerinckii]NOW85537.1 hypothetical protein [Clostridium beijerinckii]
MPLTTIEKVKSYLQIPQSNTNEDIFLQDIVDSVQEQIESHCKRKFDIDTYMETHQCKHKCFPKNTPLKEVKSIIRDDNTLESTDYKIRGNYIEFASDLKGYTIGGSVLYASDYVSEITITYTAGYDAIPKDLSMAATKLAVIEYKDSRENRIGIIQEREGDVQYTYADKSKNEVNMPSDIKKVLDKYVQVSL